MAEVRDCLDRLQNLMNAGSSSPREDAAAIVRAFQDDATDVQLRELRAQLERELASRTNAHVVTTALVTHSLILAVLEGARAATAGSEREPPGNSHR